MRERERKRRGEKGEGRGARVKPATLICFVEALAVVDSPRLGVEKVGWRLVRIRGRFDCEDKK